MFLVSFYLSTSHSIHLQTYFYKLCLKDILPLFHVLSLLCYFLQPGAELHAVISESSHFVAVCLIGGHVNQLTHALVCNKREKFIKKTYITFF